MTLPPKKKQLSRSTLVIIAIATGVLFIIVGPYIFKSTRKLEQSISHIHDETKRLLEKKNIVQGEGPALRPGQTGQFLYEGWAHDQLKKDNKGKIVIYKTRQNITIPSNEDNQNEQKQSNPDLSYIPGLVQGVEGMSEGQVDEITIPDYLLRPHDIEELGLEKNQMLVIKVKLEKIL